jgi:hypothetical protein
MNTLYSYLKAIEQKLSAPEAPEVQFLNTEIYKNESFNLKSLCHSIFEKIEDTTYLLNQLKLTIEKTKNEIFDQINSNYNNYVALISKLQTIDFLVDNIQQSFQKIKNKIDNKLNLVEKYEKELTEMLDYIKENDIEIMKIQKTIKEFDINIKASKIKEKIEKFIINNYSNIKERQYTPSRQLLFLYINYFELVRTDEKKYFNYFSTIEDILYYFSENYFIKQNNTEINLKLDLNIINLIFKIYKHTNKEDILFQKLFNGFIKSAFNKMTDTNKNISNIVTDLINYINSDKIKNLSKIFLNNKNFIKICFLKPFINKFIKEKYLFNCSDINQFVQNYLNVLKFIKIFDLEGKDDLHDIRNFLQNFSFFTYYQYLQNDLCIILTGLVKFNNKYNINNEYVLMMNNTLLNYIKAIKDIFNEQKIFLKILPNFLTFISQCSILITSKIKEVKKSSNSKNIKDNLLNEFKKNVELFKEYFKNEGEFYLNINNVYENEKFLIKEDEEKNTFKDVLITLLKSLEKMNENI